MEPEIFTQLKKYFQAGGNPEQVFFVPESKTGGSSLLFSTGYRPAVQQLHCSSSDGQFDGGMVDFGWR